MKKLFTLALVAVGLVTSVATRAQDEDKSKRPSPPAKVTETTTGGTTITIDYSQPAVKGRTIGKEIAPYGEVWRTGANEATTFEVSKDVKINGQALSAGKYALFTIPNEKEWVIILNKTAQQWGAYKYDQAQDALRVTVKPGKAKSFTERMTFTISKAGKVSLLWGNVQVDFTVQ
jgi:hypothetical protein